MLKRSLTAVALMSCLVGCGVPSTALPSANTSEIEAEGLFSRFDETAYSAASSETVYGIWKLQNHGEPLTPYVNKKLKLTGPIMISGYAASGSYSVDKSVAYLVIDVSLGKGKGDGTIQLLERLDVGLRTPDFYLAGKYDIPDGKSNGDATAFVTIKADKDGATLHMDAVKLPNGKIKKP